MRKPKGYWTKQRIFKEAHKYSTKKEFEKGCGSAYQIAWRNNFIQEMTWFEDKKKPNGFWLNNENVYQEAKKYKSRSEFRKCCSGAYNVAWKNGWLDELFPKVNSAA